MTVPASSQTTSERKPLDEEIDFFGLTHPGKVRKNNQDHFLMGSLRKRLDVYLTSLPDLDKRKLEDERLAFIAIVADGVGGGNKGEEASRLALEHATQYIAQSMRAYYGSATPDADFTEALQDAAMEIHAEVVRHANEDRDLEGMATTLTLWFGVWPWYYLLQVGDSRYYMYSDGQLRQVTRDQTMAQELIDQGVFTRSQALKTRWAHVLSSSIGGSQTAPVVTRLPASWGLVHLMCSDGLTKHVSDDKIRQRLAEMTSAKQACETLLQDALDGGGSDNITIIVGRVVPKA
jgi:protein phosphatase